MARPKKTDQPDLTAAIELTRDLVERVACPPEKAQAFLRDTKSPGLAVRVTAAGAKSFIFEAKINRKTLRRTIGDARAWAISDARAEANRLRVLVDGGQDPRELDRKQQAAQAQAAADRAAAEQRRKHTLGALCMEYCAWLDTRKKDSKDARNIFKNHLQEAFPDLWAMSAADVHRRQIIAPVRKLIETGKKSTGRKLRSNLRAAYACAVKADSDATLPSAFLAFDVSSNPVESTAAIRNTSAKNPLTMEELRLYWQQLQAEPGVIGAALRLQLLTGAQRVAQLARLHRNDVQDTTIQLFDPKGKRVEPRPHLLPITKPIRTELVKLSPEGYVLSTDGGATQMHPSSISAWASDVGKRAGIEGFQLKRVRSAVETCLAAARVSKDARAQLQSHGLGGVQDAHYDAFEYLPVKRQALDTLHKLLENKPAKNVVSLQSQLAA